MGVLAALAGVTVRERYERRKELKETRQLATAVRTELGNVADAVRSGLAAQSDKPWHVMKETVSWDIVSSAQASVADHRTIRFLHAETVAVWEFFRGPDGATVPKHECQGGALGMPLLNWPVMGETFMDENNRRYRIVSTNGIWRRGDEADWNSARELLDFFPEKSEGVTKSVLMPTDELTMKVTWPAGLAPSQVKFWQGARQSFMKVHKDPTGRPFVTETLAPLLGETVAIRWEWRT